MKVLITGANGLLGTYLKKEFLKLRTNFIPLSRSELDITEKDSVMRILRLHSPTHVINCAAYTDVTKAELDRERCFSINVEGVKNLVDASNELGVFFIHISTDFVFKGDKDDYHYDSISIREPINYYGLTKKLGEDYIIAVAQKWTIIRTSWLYGKYSNNFVNKIISLAKSQDILNVTIEESGSPTYAFDLAIAIISLLNYDKNGIYHISNKGFTSRHEFAKAILERCGLMNKVIFDNKNVVSNILRPQKVLLSDKYNPVEVNMRQWIHALEDYITNDLNVSD